MTKPLMRGMTVRELREKLAGFDDDAIVCDSDRDYGVCLHNAAYMMAGFVMLTTVDDNLEWSDTPKDRMVKAVLL